MGQEGVQSLSLGTRQSGLCEVKQGREGKGGVEGDNKSRPSGGLASQRVVASCVGFLVVS